MYPSKLRDWDDPLSGFFFFSFFFLFARFLVSLPLALLDPLRTTR